MLSHDLSHLEMQLNSLTGSSSLLSKEMTDLLKQMEANKLSCEVMSSQRDMLFKKQNETLSRIAEINEAMERKKQENNILTDKIQSKKVRRDMVDESVADIRNKLSRVIKENQTLRKAFDFFVNVSYIFS